MADIKYPFDVVYPKLSPFQHEILWEAVDKKNGGLKLPMGTGKTVISLILACFLRSNGDLPNSPIIVIAKKSVLAGWVDEIDKFFEKSIKLAIFHPDYVKINEIKVKDYDLILTTPQVIAKYYTDSNISDKFVHYITPVQFGPVIKSYRTPDEPYAASDIGGEQIFSTKWSVLIVDESQEFYGINSAQCLGISSICAGNRWLLSGTMFQEPRAKNILGYYLLLNHKGAPRNLPDLKKLIKSRHFRGVKETLVAREKNDDYENISDVNAVIISHTLTVEEGKVYLSIKGLINEIKAKLDVFKKNDDTENVKKMSSYMLAMISYLRQCLVCPLLSITAVALNVADFKCKSALARQFMEHINRLNLTDWLNDEGSLLSSRLREAIDLVKKHNEEKILVFSCYRTVLDIFKYFLPSDRPNTTIEAHDKIQTRNKKIADFSKSKNDVMLLTYQIGSSGLNLQAASTVLILDFWFNADVTSQAIHRMLRRGQAAKQVNIYYFTSNTGIENSLFNVQESKIKVANELYNGCVKSKISKMTSSAVAKMVNVDDNVKILDKITK